MVAEYPYLHAIAGRGPYKAAAVGPYGWWIVEDEHGMNCAVLGPNGQTVGTREQCEAAAERFNGRP